MTSILKATAILGSGSAVALLMGVLSNKVYALWLGPEGVGLLGLMQSLLGISMLLAGMGLASGLVRLGSPLVHSGEAIRFFALRQAAWQIYWAAAGGVAALMLIFARPIAQVFLAQSPAWTVLPVVGALLFSLASGVQLGLLNTHQRIGALAAVTALSSLIGGAVGMVSVWLWGSAALPLVVLALALAQWGTSWVFVNQLPRPSEAVDPAELRNARRELTRFGVPYMLSQLAGGAVQMGLPFLVLYALGQKEVGYYKAALLFSSAYIGFLLNALGQDFYPRLAALKDQPQAFNSSLDMQQRFVILLGSPLVVVSLAFAPMLIALLFSAQFAPAVGILSWQLLGDLFKFVAWVCGFAILAASSSRVYLMVEIMGGLSLLGFSWWGMWVYGLDGLGMGFCFAYMGYLAVLLGVLWCERGWRPARSQVSWFTMALGVALMVRVTSPPFSYLLALIWAMVCGLLLWKQATHIRAGSVGHV
jgi:PST family polysaccharide transporter